MKHKLLTALIALLVFSAVMSLISVKNYVSSLNTVIVTDTRADSLRVQATATGFLHFVSTAAIDLPEQCRIEKVLAVEGAEVEAGQSLVQLRYDDLLLCRLKLLLSKEQLQDRSGISAIEKEIIALKVRELDEQLERIEAMIAADGIVTSPVSGKVAELPSMGGSVRIGVYGDGLYCVWEVPKSDNRAFSSFCGMISQKEETFTVDAVSYDATKAVYRYKSKPFPVTGKSNVELPIEVNMTYVSDEYRAVLPKSCIRTDGDGSTFVYVVREREKVYGKELYLYKKGVTVLDQNDKYAAVMAKLEDVVEHAFRAPVHLEAVRVIE